MPTQTTDPLDFTCKDNLTIIRGVPHSGKTRHLNTVEAEARGLGKRTFLVGGLQSMSWFASRLMANQVAMAFIDDCREEDVFGLNKLAADFPNVVFYAAISR